MMRSILHRSFPLIRSFSRASPSVRSFNRFSSSAARRFFSTEAAASSGLQRSEVEERIVAAVKKFDRVDPAKVTATSNFKNDLGLDSLDGVEIVLAIEEEFKIEIGDEESDKILSIPDAVNFIIKHPQAK